MAEKLIKYYDYVKSIKGLQGTMALAIHTKIPSTKAAFEPDTDENIRIFKEAVEKVTEKPAPDL